MSLRLFPVLAIAAGVLLVPALAGWVRSDLEAPPPTRLLVDRHGAFLAQTGGSDADGWGYWPLEKVPDRVAAAILAIEDRRFADHPGVDALAVLRAAWQHLSGSGRSGASTIAMQVARMQRPGPRSLARKAVEAATAIAMVARHGREAVLRHYLRLVPFGNQSHGIAHAARWYLDKPVEDLSWAEIAFLAAIPQAPGRMNPFSDEGRDRATARGHRILERLHEGGLIDAETLALSQAQLDHLHIPERTGRPPEALHPILRIEDRLKKDGRWGLIETRLDLDIQKRVRDWAGNHLADWRRHGAEQVAAVVIERQTRRVLAWVGSDDYFAPQAGAIDFTGVVRSPGSALKPFVYALALEEGRLAPNTILADLPESQWGIVNADRDWLGPMLPRQALATSRNIPATMALRRAGLDQTYDFLAGLGLHDNWWPASRYGLVLAVGALPTTMEKLVTAYGALADEGRLLDLEWTAGQARPEAKRVLSPATARQVTAFLADPMARLPSFPRLGASREGLPLAIKTGTSQGYRDAWAVGWTSDYLVAVWTGRARGTTMRNLTGASSSAELVQRILLGLHEDRPAAAFPPPEGWQPVELCARTGLRSGGRCSETLTEWFPAGRTPEEDDVFQLVRVDLRNGLLAAPWTPDRFVGERTFADLPPEMAAWGRENHLPPPPLDLSPLDKPGGATVTAARRAGASLRVLAPRDGLRLLRNPETPAEASFLRLKAGAGPEVGRVLWLVDGRPWRLAEARETVLWPLEAGLHRFAVAREDGSNPSVEVAIEVE